MGVPSSLPSADWLSFTGIQGGRTSIPWGFSFRNSNGCVWERWVPHASNLRAGKPQGRSSGQASRSAGRATQTETYADTGLGNRENLAAEAHFPISSLLVPKMTVRGQVIDLFMPQKYEASRLEGPFFLSNHEERNHRRLLCPTKCTDHDTQDSCGFHSGV